MFKIKSNKQVKTIVVLGMHRSGTSVVAAVLSKLGVDMGKDAFGANQFNKTGHFEDEDFTALNDEILSYQNATWVNPPPVDISQVIDEKQLNKVEGVVNKHQKGMWGWKDPRTSLTISYYLPYIKNPYFIVCYRDEKQVAQSIHRRQPKITYEHGVELKRHYDLAIEMFFKNNQGLRRFNINYDDLLEKPLEYTNVLADFIDIKPSKAKISSAAKIVKKP